MINPSKSLHTTLHTKTSFNSLFLFARTNARARTHTLTLRESLFSECVELPPDPKVRTQWQGRAARPLHLYLFFTDSSLMEIWWGCAFICVSLRSVTIPSICLRHPALCPYWRSRRALLTLAVTTRQSVLFPMKLHAKNEIPKSTKHLPTSYVWQIWWIDLYFKQWT